MVFEIDTSPSLQNDQVIRNILSFPYATNHEENEWNKIVKKIETIHFNTQIRLNQLKEASLPESVHRIIQDVKQIYGHQAYLFNNDVWIYNGMTVEWDKNTGKIQSIILSVQVGNHTLQFLVNPKGSYDILSTNSDDEMVRVGYENNSKYWIRIWTNDWKEDHPDATDKENYQKILPKIRKSVWGRGSKWKIPSPVGTVATTQAIPPHPVEKNDTESQGILTEHFAGISREIPGIDGSTVYGRKSQKGEYEMVFDIKDSPILICGKDTTGKYSVSSVTNGSFDHYSEGIMMIWTQEHRIVYDEKTKNISLPLTERQIFIERFPEKGFSLHPNTKKDLYWNGEWVSLNQAKVIEAFEGKMFDFWGTYGMKKLKISKNKRTTDQNYTVTDLYLTRENSTDDDYFVIIIGDSNISWGPVMASIKRSWFTYIIWTTANTAEETLIQAVRARLTHP